MLPGVGQTTALELVHGEPRIGPGNRFGVARARGLDRRPHHVDRAVEVAPEPAQVRRAGIGLVERLEVDHLLIRLRRLRHAALLHQRVAEEPEVEHELAQRDQAARDRLRLAEAVHLVQDVPSEQQRRRLVRLHRLEARGRLFRHGVVARVVGHARPRHEAIAEVFGRACGGATFAHVVLQLRDVAIAGGRDRDDDLAGPIDVRGFRSGDGLAAGRSQGQEQGDRRRRPGEPHTRLQSQRSYYGRGAQMDVRRESPTGGLRLVRNGTDGVRDRTGRHRAYELRGGGTLDGDTAALAHQLPASHAAARQRRKESSHETDHAIHSPFQSLGRLPPHQAHAATAATDRICMDVAHQQRFWRDPSDMQAWT